MSIVPCMGCSRRIDTDYEEMVVEETKYGDYVICQSCAEKQEAMRERADAMAAQAEARQ